jgi:hypothetical protein
MNKLYGLVFVLLATTCWSQTTPNLGLNLPPSGSANWGTLLNANFNMLDSYLSGLQPLPGSLVINGSLTVNGACIGCGGFTNPVPGPLQVSGVSFYALTPDPYCAFNLSAFGYPDYICELSSNSTLYFYPNGPNGFGRAFAFLNIMQTFTQPQIFQSSVFASLPACASNIMGAVKTVSDSTTNTWGATITGGGSDPVLAFCDGTNWTVAAK